MVGKEPEFNPPWEQVLAEDTASPPRELTRPYHLRRSRMDDYRYRLTTPLIHVFSVRVFTRFDDEEPSEINGSIRVLEESYPRFILYHRKPDDSETETETERKYGTTLSLIGPNDGAIIPFISTTLKIRLRDRRRGVKVVEGQLEFDSGNRDSYDRLLEHVVEGPNGYAIVYYVVFQFAIYATIRVKVTKIDNDDQNCNSADIYGSIVAGYDNGRLFCGVNENLNTLQTRLFDKPADKPLRVLLGEPIMLSRNVVVVPVYSPLVIKISLCYSDGKNIDLCLPFEPYELGEKPLSFPTKYACVELYVQWKNAYNYFYRERFWLYSDEQEKSIEQKETPKNPRRR